MYSSRYNLFTYNLMFYLGLASREWVDGLGCIWMTTSILGMQSYFGVGFGAGLTGLSFP